MRVNLFKVVGGRAQLLLMLETAFVYSYVPVIAPSSDLFFIHMHLTYLFGVKHDDNESVVI